MAASRLARGRRGKSRAVERVRALFRSDSTRSRRSSRLSRRPSADPTLISVAVTDRVSGLALRSDRTQPPRHRHLASTPTTRPEATAFSLGSTIRFSRPASTRCAPLPGIKPSNQNSTGRRANGEPMTADAAASRADRSTGRHRTERTVRRTSKATRKAPNGDTKRWSSSDLAQRCATASACPSPGSLGESGRASRCRGSGAGLCRRTPPIVGQLVGVRDDRCAGRFSYRALADASRTLRFVYSGSSRDASGGDEP